VLVVLDHTRKQAPPGVPENFRRSARYPPDYTGPPIQCSAAMTLNPIYSMRLRQGSYRLGFAIPVSGHTARTFNLPVWQ
jgi:hypothetical protein